MMDEDWGNSSSDEDFDADASDGGSSEEEPESEEEFGDPSSPAEDPEVGVRARREADEDRRQRAALSASKHWRLKRKRYEEDWKRLEHGVLRSTGLEGATSEAKTDYARRRLKEMTDAMLDGHDSSRPRLHQKLKEHRWSSEPTIRSPFVFPFQGKMGPKIFESGECSPEALYLESIGEEALSLIQKHTNARLELRRQRALASEAAAAAAGTKTKAGEKPRVESTYMEPMDRRELLLLLAANLHMRLNPQRNLYAYFR